MIFFYICNSECWIVIRPHHWSVPALRRTLSQSFISPLRRHVTQEDSVTNPQRKWACVPLPPTSRSYGSGVGGQREKRGVLLTRQPVYLFLFRIWEPVFRSTVGKTLLVWLVVVGFFLVDSWEFLPWLFWTNVIVTVLFKQSELTRQFWVWLWTLRNLGA